MDRVLVDRSQAIVGSIEASATPQGLQVPDSVLEPGVVVYDERSQPLAGVVPAAQADAFERLASAGDPTTARAADDYELRAQPFVTAAGPAGVVVISEPLAPYERDERSALIVSVIAGVVLVGSACAVAAWSSRRALAPVARMAATAGEWSAHDLDRRFDLGPPTNEIRALGQTLDDLLGRVAGAIQAEQRLTSELAHELRTPLTAAQGTAELLGLRDDLTPETRRDVRDILQHCQTMAATMTGLLALARGQSRGAGTTSCELRAVLDSLGRDVGWPDSLSVTDPGAVLLAAPHDLAVRALAPVVANALGLAERVRISATVTGGMAGIHVSDDGPGVAEHDAERIFEPGHTTGEGSGLGLPLSRRIARSLGGDVVVAPSRGAGAEFVVSIPTTRPTPGTNGSRP